MSVEETGQKVCRDEFVKIYMKVWRESVTPAIVRTTWRKTGLHPFNPNIFTAADFAPSRPYSTQLSFPPSFPVSSNSNSEVQRSEVIADSDATSTSMISTNTPPSSAAISPVPLPTLILPTVASEPEINLQSLDSKSSSAAADEAANTTAELTRQYIPLPGPRCPEFSSTSIRPRASAAEQVQVLRADLARCKALYEAEFKRRRTAETHCAFSLLEIKKLKLRLNAKQKDKQRKNNHFGSKAVAMMLPEARRERERAQAEKQQKDQAKSDKENKQAEKDHADMERHAALASGTVIVEYSGSLKGTKKPELQDIAFLLGIKDYGGLLGDQLRVQIKERLLEKRETYQHNT
ncbi:hypothetical protein BC835DRAFT_1416855 [Cytidiella melzeri]|nr:hypothetical protein BC835DRAFT_1416855 [Cytidiella melzeri]